MKNITAMTQEINTILNKNKLTIQKIVLTQYKDKLLSTKKGLDLVTELNKKPDEFLYSLSKVLSKSEINYINCQIAESVSVIENSWLDDASHSNPMEYLLDDQIIENHQKVKEKLAV